MVAHRPVHGECHDVALCELAIETAKESLNVESPSRSYFVQVAQHHCNQKRLALHTL